MELAILIWMKIGHELRGHSLSFCHIKDGRPWAYLAPISKNLY